MKTLAFALTAVLLLAAAPAPPPTLYDRVAAKLAADPALAASLGQKPKELDFVHWMLGRWTITARVFATPKTPERVDHGEAVVEEFLGGTWLQSRESYAGAINDVSYLTYNPASHQWVSTGVDHLGNTVTARATGWTNNRLVFTIPDALILGERVTLRQTIEKRSATEYRVLNEERLPNGKWIALDEYVYVKVP